MKLQEKIKERGKDLLVPASEGAIRKILHSNIGDQAVLIKSLADCLGFMDEESVKELKRRLYFNESFTEIEHIDFALTTVKDDVSNLDLEYSVERLWEIASNYIMDGDNKYLEKRKDVIIYFGDDIKGSPAFQGVMERLEWKKNITTDKKTKKLLEEIIIELEK